MFVQNILMFHDVHTEVKNEGCHASCKSVRMAHCQIKANVYFISNVLDDIYVNKEPSEENEVSRDLVCVKNQS